MTLYFENRARAHISHATADLWCPCKLQFSVIDTYWTEITRTRDNLESGIETANEQVIPYINRTMFTLYPFRKSESHNSQSLLKYHDLLTLINNQYI